jgi:DNA polymerase I-like protein with 3'-5' exonuclease and polymerase domains
MQNLQAILESEYIVLDIESTGLNVRKDKVIGIGLSNGSNSDYVIIWSWNGQELERKCTDEAIICVLKKLINKKIICHNAAYDLRIIKHNFGVDLVPYLYADTILLKHTVNEERPFGLKDIAVKYANELGFYTDPTKEKKEMEESIKAAGGKCTKDQYELYKANPDIIARYCIQDCVLTWKLFTFFSEKLIEEGLVDFYYKDEVMPLYKEVSIPMMERGIKVNVDRIKEYQIQIKEDLEKLEIEVQDKLTKYSENFKKWFFEKEYAPKPTGAFAQELVKIMNLPLPLTKTGKTSLAKAAVSSLPPSIAKDFLLGKSQLPAELVQKIQWEIHGTEKGKYFINIKSKDHLKRIIFNYLGEVPDRKTDKGGWQLGDDFLHSIAHKYDFIPPLLIFNKLSKISSTYYDRILEGQENGIFYPEFNQHRTISGRFGSDIQQLPRPMEEGNPILLKYNNVIREFFIARPWHIFVDSDYESLEPHVFASVSGDKKLQDIFNRGDDFYSTIAIMTEKLEGVSADKKAENYLGKVNKSARQKAKAYSLGIPYSMSDYKLSKELDIPQAEAQRLINQYLSAFPDLKNWMDRTDLQVKTQGWVCTLVGRKRRMPEAPIIYKEHGEGILDSLELWKKYNENPAIYEEMKEVRNRMKNYIGNGRNFQIQSLSASIVNRASIAVSRALKFKKLDAHILLNIHDQLVIECRSSDVQAVSEVVQLCMENAISLPVKLKAPPTVGKNLRESH